MALDYVHGASKPDTHIEWPDADGDPVDFSAQTLTAKIGHTSKAALVTKTTGITGASTFPNITIVWNGELEALSPGVYTLTLEASDGRRRNITLRLSAAVG